MPSQSPAAPPIESAAVRRGRPSRRDKIFAAALRLFRAQGFHATSLNDIGAAAGVAGTAVYAHFPTKQALLAEAIGEGAQRISDGVRHALAESPQTPAEALDALVEAYVRVVLDNADTYACYVLELRNLGSDQRAPFVRSERTLRTLWRKRLQAVRPELSEEQAQLMVQMAIFALLALCLHRHRLDREQLEALAHAQVMASLQAPLTSTNP